MKKKLMALNLAFLAALVRSHGNSIPVIDVVLKPAHIPLLLPVPM